MFCPKCGTRVADDDYACYKCGSRLNNNVRSALDELIEQDKKRLKEGKNLYAWERDPDGKNSGDGQSDEQTSVDDQPEEKVSASEHTQNKVSAADQPHGNTSMDEHSDTQTDDPIEATVRDMFERKDSGQDNVESIAQSVSSAVTDRGEQDRVAARPDAYIYGEQENGEDAKKVGNTKAVVVLFIVFLLVAGGAWMWFNRPSARIDEAIQFEDTETVTELYDQLPTEEEKEEVRVSMIERVRELYADYIEERITYDEVMAEYDTLKENVLDDSDEFEELNAKIERINDSRRIYEKAEKNFEHGKYRDAIDSYKEVIEEDEKYYDLAQENILKANEAVTEQLLGRWSYEYDAHKEVEEFVKAKGFNVDLSKMKIPICFMFDIRDDQTIVVSVDYDALDEYVDKILDLAVDAVNKGLGGEAFSSSEVSGWIKYMYGASGLKDSVKKSLNFREALDSLIIDAGMDKPIPYYVEDGRLYINETCIEPEVDDDLMTLDSDDGDSLTFGKYDMIFPIKMKRSAEQGEESSKERKDNKDSQDSKGSKTEENGSKDKEDSENGSSTEDKDSKRSSDGTGDKDSGNEKGSKNAGKNIRDGKIKSGENSGTTINNKDDSSSTGSGTGSEDRKQNGKNIESDKKTDSSTEKTP